MKEVSKQQGLQHLEGPNLGTKIDNVVDTSALSRGEQNFLVHNEGLDTNKGFLDGRCTARAGGEEQAPPPFQQWGICGTLQFKVK